MTKRDHAGNLHGQLCGMYFQVFRSTDQSFRKTAQRCADRVLAHLRGQITALIGLDDVR